LRGIARPQYRLRVEEVRVFYDVSGSTVQVLAIVPKSEAETQDVVITRHGKPAGVLIGFKSEDDWFDYRLENDPRFLQRVEQARASVRAGRGVKLEDVK